MYREETRMTDMSGFLDYSDDAGITFYAYPADRVVSIVEVWAKAPWPMTLQEAFTLRDQCGWTPAAPDDGRFFTTPVGNGEIDGAIRRDVRDRNLVSVIDVRMTTRVPIDLESQVSAITQSIYVGYRDALSAIYGPPEDDVDSTGTYADWTLGSNVLINLSSVGTFVKIMINSPAETERKVVAAYYESKYGPDAP